MYEPYIDTSNFSMCCGADEIGDFPDFDDYVSEPRHGGEKPPTFEQAVSAFTQTLRNRLLNGRAYIATTIASQRLAVAGLNRAGFRRAGSWVNANTNNRVTLWFKGQSNPRRARRRS